MFTSAENEHRETDSVTTVDKVTTVDGTQKRRKEKRQKALDKRG